MYHSTRRLDATLKKITLSTWLIPAGVLAILLAIECSFSEQTILPAYTIFATVVAASIVATNFVRKRQQEDALIEIVKQVCQESPELQDRATSVIHSPKLREMLRELFQSYRTMSRNFEEAVVERTIKLASAVEDANSANRAKSTFLATMSHELRTPLNGIIGMGELLLSTPLSTDQQLYVRMAKESAEGMVSIINDLLDLSKIHAGFFTLQPEPTDLETIVSQVFRSIGVRGSMKGLEVACEISPAPLPNVMLDPLRFRQVLLNLVGNAIKFTDKGGVVVSISLDVEGKEKLDSKCSLRVSVRDTGSGIPDAAKGRLFKPFMSGLESPKPNVEGTGLGLSIVKELVGLMGGAVTCESQEGHGSTFTISIPSLALATNNAGMTTLPCPKPILLIHGDGMAARSVLNALVSYGYQIHVVKSVEAALKSAANRSGTAESWQCAVVSHEHAIANLEATSRLAQLLDGRVIATLPSDRLPDMNSLIALGVQEVVSRPFVPSEIVHSIERFVQKGAHQSEPYTDTFKAYGHERTESLRILVSDDTSVNRMVAKLLLEKCGHRVETAGNGRETLEMVAASNHFDLILLDLELPDLDGLEVARRIRAGNSGSAAIPIIALTAHDSDSYRELCTDAGMDDCISKPVSIETLSYVIRATTALSERSEDLYKTLTVKRARAEQYQHSGIDLDDMRHRYGDDEELIVAIAESFIEEVSQLRNRLAEAVEGGDRRRVGSVAHAIKSSAASVSARDLWESADHLEQAANSKCESNLAPYLTQLSRQWDKAVESLARFKRNRSVADTTLTPP